MLITSEVVFQWTFFHCSFVLLYGTECRTVASQSARSKIYTVVFQHNTEEVKIYHVVELLEF